MADTLVYDLKGARLHGIVGGSLVSVPTYPASDRIYTWGKTQELRSGRAAGGHFDADGGYVLTGVRHRAGHVDPGRRIGLRGVGPVFAGTFYVKPVSHALDYPGGYAQRFDGDGTGLMLTEGDPDNPVIVGSPPSPQSPPPPPPPPSGPVPIPYPNLAAAGGTSGLLIRPWPPSATGPVTIVAMAGWAQFMAAVRQTRQVSLVLEL
jgi:hypothetical protein